MPSPLLLSLGMSGFVLHGDLSRNLLYLLLCVVTMDTIGTIYIYKLKGLDQIERDKFCRKLLGRTVKTHHGKYVHHVEGLLDTIPHIRINRGVIIAEKVSEQKISTFFKDHKIQHVFIRDLFLINDDIRRMKNGNTRQN